MTISLHTLPKRHGRRSKRLGRGHGSGRGTYAGRGLKGQRSRTGGRKGAFRRAMAQTISKLPKRRGFRSIRPKYCVVALGFLDRSYKPGDTVTPATLVQHGVRCGKQRVKILGSGTLTKALRVRVHSFSNGAERAILKAGGSIERLTA